jgi:hypothetical protein
MTDSTVTRFYYPRPTKQLLGIEVLRKLDWLNCRAPHQQKRTYASEDYNH